MDAGLDTGPVLARARCSIRDDDTGGSLQERLAALGAATLVETLAALEAGDVRAEPQDDAQASYAARIRKRDGLLDWAKPAQALERQVRAYNPWPVAYAFRPAQEYSGAERGGDRNERLRIWSARVVAGKRGAAPGTVLASGSSGIDVASGRDALRILSLQPAGKRIMSSADYLNAHALPAGTRLQSDGVACR